MNQITKLTFTFLKQFGSAYLTKTAKYTSLKADANHGLRRFINVQSRVTTKFTLYIQHTIFLRL